MIIMTHVSFAANIVLTYSNYVLFLARKARVFYQTQTATLCDICEADDCENVCTTNPDTRIGGEGGNDGKGGGYVTSPISSAIFLIAIVYLFLN